MDERLTFYNFQYEMKDVISVKSQCYNYDMKLNVYIDECVE